MSEVEGRAGDQSGYLVLARKYRPARFDDLIGQQAMVRTLRNAFAAGRIAHAWMLTGVRGVGKTTTARILARGLNYAANGDGAAPAGGPTVDFGEPGIHCQAIMEGRHPDVIEIDAASHTGIDDIRDIIESARYAPVSARFKVYIIDEVHMLSKSAFNGLLKTLEEPPPHVKFVFATTEIRKVPVTILSRCQRFDLKRVDAADLIANLAHIAEQEGVTVAEPALRIIARAAEGSVRDAQSMLDQAIAHSGGDINAETVQAMLGLADRTRTVDLFADVAAGRTAQALDRMAELHRTGAEPLVVLTDLADFTHFITRIKIAPAAADDPGVSETERTRGLEFAETLSIRTLSTFWQMLLAGIDEAARSPRPAAAADMVLVRLCHAADLPSPDEVLRALADRANPSGQSAPAQNGDIRSGGSPVSDSGSSAAAGHSGQTGSPGRSAMGDPGAGSPVLSGQRQDAATAATARKVEPSFPPAPDRTPEPAAPPPALPDGVHDRFGSLLDLARERRDRLMLRALERDVIPLGLNDRRLEIALTPDADPGLPQRIGEALQSWTGERWFVIIGTPGPEAMSVHQRRKVENAKVITEIKSDPLVAHVLDTFPGAEIVGVRDMRTTERANRDEE